MVYLIRLRLIVYWMINLIVWCPLSPGSGLFFENKNLENSTNYYVIINQQCDNHIVIDNPQ